MKKILTTIIIFSFCVESTGIAYAQPMPAQEGGFLRPMAAANSVKLSSAGNQQRIVIDTNELALGKKETISVQQMLTTFSQKHPDLLSDPESVLIVLRQQDAKLIFKTEFNNAKGAPVRSDESYRIAFQHPRFHIDTRLPIPRGIWVSLGSLKSTEKDELDEIFEKIGEFSFRVQRGAGLVTGKWIDKKLKQGLTKLDLAKKVLVYYYKEFDYKPNRYYQNVEGIYCVMNILLADKEVDTFLAQLLKAYYASGEDAYVKDATIDGKVYINDFDFLLSLFIGKDDEDIVSIAVHLLLEASGFDRGMFASVMDEGPSGLPLFAQSMLVANHPAINRASLLRLLQYDKNEHLISRSAARAKEGILKDEFISDLIRDIFCLLKLNKKETSIRAFNQMDTMDRLARVINRLGENAICDFMNLVMKEEDRDTAEKMSYFLDRLCHMAYVNITLPKIGKNHKVFTVGFYRKWVDVLIFLASKHNLSMRQTLYLKRMLKGADGYRRQDVEAALIPLLYDTKRNDIGFILDILSVYESKKAEGVIVDKYLKVSSPHLGAAFRYLSRLKDPGYFEDVWKFIEKLDSSKKEIGIKNLVSVGRYLIKMLKLTGEKALTEEQKAKVKAFVDKHILGKDLSIILNSLDEDEFGRDRSGIILPDESSDYSENISFIRVWVLLAGLLKEADKLDSIKKAAGRSLKYINILDAVLIALLLLPSEESYQFLVDFSMRIMLKDKDKSYLSRDDPISYLYKLLKTNVPQADQERRRRFLVELMDAAVSNESHSKFKKFLEIFISSDPQGALGVLNSGRWIDVDISDIEPDPMPSKSYGFANAIYSFKGLREYFLKWYFGFLRKPAVVKDLRLLYDKKEFFDRVRYGIRTLLLIELGIIGDEKERHKERIEFLLNAAMYHAGWSHYIGVEERLGSVVALKPVIDIMGLNVDLKRQKGDVGDAIWQELKRCDPDFYAPLEEGMRAYIRWLVENNIIAEDTKQTLDRFGAYFFKGKPQNYQIVRLCDIKTAEKRIDQFGKFLRANVTKFFYPDKKKEEDMYDFSQAFPFTLVSVLNKHVMDKKAKSRDADIFWPMLLLPESESRDALPQAGVPAMKSLPGEKAIIAISASA